MENKQFKQIEDTIKALQKELSPIFDEIAELKAELGKLNESNKNNPLIELITRITKTARRHDIDKKITSKNSQYIIGTNHNGLGYQESYSSQLTELSNNYYGNSKYKEQIIRDTLLDSEAVIDLTAIIKKSNQKTFMKVVKILQNHNLKIPFEEFQEQKIDNIEVNTDKDDIKIKVELYGSRQTSFWIYSDGEIVGCLRIDNIKEKPEICIEKESVKALNDISEKAILGLSVMDIKMCFYLTKHKESIINAIKSSRTLLKATTSDYTSEQKELNELLEPILTLEKL